MTDSFRRMWMMTGTVSWPVRKKADGTSDLEERLNDYITTERTHAINRLAEEEELDSAVLNHYLSEYDYLQKENLKLFRRL